MSAFNFSSGTTALTNALKQVFYIHKDVVAELKDKLDSLTKENDNLKQQKEEPKNVPVYCESCKSLEELNRSLQKTFNRQLKVKDAIIMRLEARLKEFVGSIDTLIGTENSLSLDVEKSSSQFATLNTSGPPGNNSKDSVASLSTSPNSGNAVGSKHASSKLKLPKEGQKRRRYVEQENLPDSKRQKSSPTASPVRNLPQFDSQNKRVDLSQKRSCKRLTRTNSGEFQKASPSPSRNVLVPETENFTCLDEDGRRRESSAFTTQRLKDLTNEKSPNFLTIPETLVVDELSQEYGDGGEDGKGEECQDTLIEIGKQHLPGFTDKALCEESSGDNSSPDSVTPKKIAGGVSDISISIPGNLSRVFKNELEGGRESDEKCGVVERGVECAGLNGNVSMSSPLSPGIFEALAQPLSSSYTPRTSKSIDLSDSSSGKKFISCSSKPSKEIEKFLRSKSAADAFDKRGLLRQTTLSQSFCNKNNISLKQGARKSKSLRNRSDYDKEKEEEEEEAILKEVLERSLMDAGKKSQEAMASGALSSNNPTNDAMKSPFKVPLSPGKGIRNSPRSKVKNGSVNSRTIQKVEGLEKEGSGEEQFVCGENYYCGDSDNDVFADSPSSPLRKVKVESDQGLRRSPRLLSTSPARSDRSLAGSGDIAKRALFLGDKGNGSLASSKKNAVQAQQTPPKSGIFKAFSKNPDTEFKEKSSNGFDSIPDWAVDGSYDDGVKVRNTAVSQSLNSSIDPVMRLSMYLDSEATGPTSASHGKSPKRKALVVNQNSSAPPPAPLLSSLQSEMRVIDMDETVAPNGMSFPVTVDTGQSQRLSQTTRTTRERTNLSRQHVDDSQNRRGSTKGCHGDQDKSVNCDHPADGSDDDDIEETIAPSPQQQSARPFHSQSLSGMSTYTSHSFKFVPTARHNRASADAGKSRDLQAEGDEQSLDFIDVDVADDGSNNSGNNMGDNFGEDIAGVDQVCNSKSFTKPSSLPRAVPPVASLYDSFDVVPQKSPEFPHVQVVRKKLDRDKLEGFSCHQCAQYYKDMNLSERELQQRMRACSRHKEKYKPPSTPEHFWSLSIRDTAEDQADAVEKQPEVVRLRRRRRLAKKFKSKTEEEGGEEEGEEDRKH